MSVLEKALRAYRAGLTLELIDVAENMASGEISADEFVNEVIRIKHDINLVAQHLSEIGVS